MNPAAINIDGSALEIDGQRILIPAWKSLKKVSGLETWWNPIGVLDGYFVNLEPDDVPQIDNDGPGGRAGFYYDVGTTNYTIEMYQKFQNLDGWDEEDEVYCGAGLITCLDFENPGLGLALWYEPWFLGGLVVVYRLGGPPEEISFLNEEPGYEHVIAHRVPNTVIDQETGLFHSKMVVTEDTIACYCNGDDLLFVFDIPEEFKGSTLCGATIDMGASNNRYPNIEAIVSPITITTRAAAS